MSERPTSSPLEARALASAFQFLTVAPPMLRRALLPEELGHAVAYYPLVGLALGGVLAALHWGLGLVLPTAVAAALVLAAWEWATGGLHLDGFLDCCDGLLGGFTAEDRLRIMRDERVGAYAVIGGVLLLLVKYVAIANSHDALAALVLAPVLGRWAMATAVVAFPYARPKGLGRDIKDRSGPTQWVAATAIAVAVTLIWGGVTGAIALVVVAIGTWLGARFILARIPGMTGDTYGALCQVGEALALLVFAARLAV